MKHTRNILLAAAALGAFFIFSVYHLLNIQVETGDIYPRYSSFRADPKGTRILFESLEKFHHLDVQRNIDHLNPQNVKDNTAAFFIDFDVIDVFKIMGGYLNLVDYTQAVCAEGGTVIITSTGGTILSAGLQKIEEKEKELKKKKDAQKSKEKKKDENEISEEDAEEKHRQLMRFLNFKPKTLALPTAHSELVTMPDTARRVIDIPDLPETMTWHSDIVFENVGDEWEPIYMRKTYPVIMRRKLLDGWIIVSSDSFFLSNEAMWKDRHVSLIQWMIGSATTVMFDEFHLGVVKKRGVASLIRRYNLFALFGVFVAIALIFIWRNAFFYIPANDDAYIQLERIHEKGKDSDAALLNLMESHIPSANILNLCYNEWVSSFQHLPKKLRQEVNAVINEENAKPKKEQNPVDTYNRICNIIKKES